MPKRKPVVNYRPIDDVGGWQIKVGYCALVQPINHPDITRVSNTRPAITSEIIRVDNDGEFETQNTIYRPLKETENV